MGKAGRPTNLDEELLREIKQGVLAGLDLKQIAVQSEIPESTLYTWHSDNYLSIADKVEGWRRDRKLMLAEKNIEEFLEMSTQNIMNKEGNLIEQTDAALVRVKADISKFVAQTLGKKDYSQRNELSGPDGKELPAPILNYVCSNNGNKEDIKSK
jgi:fructosamine-3-kinase